MDASTCSASVVTLATGTFGSTSRTARRTSATTDIGGTIGAKHEFQVCAAAALKRIPIDRARRRLVQIVVLRIADHADDLERRGLTFHGELMAEGIARPEVVARHRLIDDRDGRASFVCRTRSRGRR